jgi:hypothetical protein
MATTFTLDDLAAIERAIVSGTRRVKYADREVEYRSLSDLRAIAETIRRALGQSDGELRTSYFETHKDLG